MPESIKKESKEIHRVLKQYWGYDGFRASQETIINETLAGNSCLGVMPTGAGKSICYQIPGLLLDGVTLVISPLIALMKDQIKGLTDRGISAVGIYSGQNKRTQDILLDNAIYGDVDFLFVSPERLRTQLFKERFKKMNVALVTVDEAHCISQWGHDFRPEYRLIAELKEIHPDIKILALTATATGEVVTDICDNLGIKPTSTFVSSPIRYNLSYGIIKTESKKELLLGLTKTNTGSVIIYVNTRLASKEIECYLKAKGEKCMSYHGGMSKKDRDKVSEAWVNGKTRIIIATKAFGMGIDKADVRKVIHYDVPQSLEAYVQEAGRAGRDGQSAEAILLYNQADLRKFEKLISENFPSIEYIQDVYGKVCKHLAVASGPTDLEFYPFYIADFCGKHNLRKNKVANALRLLHQSELIFLSDAILHPSQLHLKEGACKALMKNPELSPKMKEFIKLILRSYEGLFLEYSVIDEYHLSKRFGENKSKIEKALQWLHKTNVAVYRPAYEGHTISFNEYRHKASELPINVKEYEKRKARMTNSIDVMVGYIENEACRQQHIAKYFSFTESECGTCDICMINNQSISKSELKNSLETILRLEEISVPELYGRFHAGSHRALEEVLREMESERELSINGNKLKLSRN